MGAFKIQLVLMAGGKGERLRPLTNDIPKPLANINNKPLLQHTIKWAKSQSITDIIITIGYLGNKIKEYFKDGSQFGVNITYFEETEPLGTGGAFAFLKDKLKDDFLALNADTLCNSFNTKDLIQFHKKNNSDATIVVFDSDHPYDSDVIEFNQQQKVTKFCLRPHKIPPKSNKCIAGLYLISQKTLHHIPKNKFSLELELLPLLHKKRYNVFCYPTKLDFIDIGNIERLRRAEQILK